MVSLVKNRFKKKKKLKNTNFSSLRVVLKIIDQLQIVIQKKNYLFF